MEKNDLADVQIRIDLVDAQTNEYFLLTRSHFADRIKNIQKPPSISEDLRERYNLLTANIYTAISNCRSQRLGYYQFTNAEVFGFSSKNLVNDDGLSFILQVI
jgi:hypothetical protein